MHWLSILFQTHRWGRWEVIETATILEATPFLVNGGKIGTEDWRETGTSYKQRRRCETCGLSQFRLTKVKI